MQQRTVLGRINRPLQVNSHFGAFVAIYNMSARLDRSKFKVSANCMQMFWSISKFRKKGSFMFLVDFDESFTSIP